MEKKIYFLRKKLLWAFVTFQIAMLSSATNLTTTDAPQVPQVTEMGNVWVETERQAYAWSAWSSWSPCSRTCGGGVSVQERQCLPRVRTVAAPANSSIAPPVITVRVTRQTHEPDCQGVDKRYHECNDIPCPGGMRNTRAAQCAAFDRRPFRGRFYTWVPYIDGNAPCTLNCRPMGQQFYASLSLVADGTPCTRQGYRAICVQGTCKAVGQEGVLSSASSRELRCGRRLVSGLFSRPRLPLGYSYVATVPRGACRINVTELMPSDNYIALKISNGSYIMNGEFAVSAPGMYEAAGARFLYSRVGSLDTVLAHGPIHHAVDIMILYTQTNPAIKYEYFTESAPGEVESVSVTKTDSDDINPPTKHFRRHHSYLRVASKHPDVSKESTGSEEDFDEVIVGNRKFVWKILSYTQCTRSCGGGIQVGKYRCVESNAGDREVSPIHCSGSAPNPRRRRCAPAPCPPRWRAANWSSCPNCGPATRTRIVGCVQDHSRGITKISDQKCPAPKPPTSEKCQVPDCNTLYQGFMRTITSKRVAKPRRDYTETFKEGPVYTVTVNSSDPEVGPEYSFSATSGWMYTEWSECVGWCVGGGVQTRGVRCADPSGCTPNEAPDTSRACVPKQTCEKLEGHWYTGDWSPCSSSCQGKQVRGVLCVGATGRLLKESACKAPKPAHQQDCSTKCEPAWYYGDWGQCIGDCTSGKTTGLQRRTAVCARVDGIASEIECRVSPHTSQTCDPQCTSGSVTTVSPALTIESQKVSAFETINKSESTPNSVFETTEKNEILHIGVNRNHILSQECVDRLSNCNLAVQARLCHYKYYIHNCCHSCAVVRSVISHI